MSLKTIFFLTAEHPGIAYMGKGRVLPPGAGQVVCFLLFRQLVFGNSPNLRLIAPASLHSKRYQAT